MANKQNLKVIRDSERARELQVKSAEKRRQNIIDKRNIKLAILERLEDDDFAEIIDNAIKRAKRYDKSFEVFRDTLGQKPIETQQIIDNRESVYDELTADELRELIKNETKL